jgi:hypothetical protein
MVPCPGVQRVDLGHWPSESFPPNMFPRDGPSTTGISVPKSKVGLSHQRVSSIKNFFSEKKKMNFHSRSSSSSLGRRLLSLSLRAALSNWAC